MRSKKNLVIGFLLLFLGIELSGDSLLLSILAGVAGIVMMILYAASNGALCGYHPLRASPDSAGELQSETQRPSTDGCCVILLSLFTVKRCFVFLGERS